MADALITHPHVGSVWLQRVTIEGDFVVGEVEDGNGYTEPRYATMNFPRSCVRKWSTDHAPDCEVHSLGACDCEKGGNDQSTERGQ